MKTLLYIIFISSLPALIFLGHDLYIFYEAQGKPMDAQIVTKIASEDRPAKQFDFTSIGFLLNRYAPDMHQSLRDGLSEDDQQSFALFLTFKGFYLSIAFSLLITLISALIIGFKAAREKTMSEAQRRRRKRNNMRA